jgi:regulation of enolase protein 1 (concanavalin A-like superfamily)
MNEPPTIPSLPVKLSWKNEPVEWSVEKGGRMRIVAGAKTDWFIDPAGGSSHCNAPVALFAPSETTFLLSARVAVDFAATYDAGVLFAHAGDTNWAKLCFEYSPRHQPMIVSVVTRGVSDDCNSAVVGEAPVYLRLSRRGRAFAFHFSLDGRSWELVRHFSLGETGTPSIGFSAQSPTGERCAATFSEIEYLPGRTVDLRSGE